MNLYSHFPRCAPVLIVPAAGLWGKRVMLISEVLCCDDAPSTNTMPYTSRHLLKSVIKTDNLPLVISPFLYH